MLHSYFDLRERVRPRSPLPHPHLAPLIRPAKAEERTRIASFAHAYQGDGQDYLDKEHVEGLSGVLVTLTRFPKPLARIVAQYLAGMRRFSLEELARPENALFAGFSTDPSLCGISMVSLWERLGANKLTQLCVDRLQVTRGHDVQPSPSGRHTPVLYASTDIGFLSIQATCAPEGQYYQDNSTTVYFSPPDGLKPSPGNVGGFHWCVVDTRATESDWVLCSQLTDAVLSRDGSLHDMGARTRFAALVQKEYAGFTSSPMKGEDECKALVAVAEIRLPSGRVCLGATGLQMALMPHGPECRCVPEVAAADPLHIPTGHGDGYYPVEVHRAGTAVERVHVQFIE